jgi:chemotaxis protein MotB
MKIKEKSEEQKQIEEELNELYEKLNEYVADNGLDDALLLTKDGLYIYLTIVEGILFDSGRANIRSEEAETILADISHMLSDYMDDIQSFTIEGHTDNNPINTDLFEDNLDLSSKRANNVARFMSSSANLPMQMFESLGRGEWSPIASNDTAEGREKNRRVNVIVLAKNVDEIMENGVGAEIGDIPMEPVGPEPETAETASQPPAEGVVRETIDMQEEEQNAPAN